MNTSRHLGLTGLIVSAGLILMGWQGWVHHGTQCLAVGIAFPLYVAMGRPWTWRVLPKHPPAWTAAAGTAAAIAACVAGSAGWAACAWTFFLLVFLETVVESPARRRALLPFLGFPWIGADLHSADWWLRSSGAAAIDWVFFALGIEVERHGVCLMLEGKPLSIDASCAGLEMLPLLGIAGYALVCLYVPPGKRFCWAAACVPVLVWLAAAVRMVVMGTLTLSYGAALASDWSRDWGDWLTLCLMLVLARALFPWIATVTFRADGPVRWV